MQEKNWIISTKKGKGTIPLFRGNGGQVIPIYGCQILISEIGQNNQNLVQLDFANLYSLNEDKHI